jgi:hypothetical protein
MKQTNAAGKKAGAEELDEGDSRLNRQAVPPADSSAWLRPKKSDDPTAYPVADEMILVPSHGDRIYALNSSGAAIWEMCDGRHSLSDMIKSLGERFEGDHLQMMSDLTTALFQFRALDLLQHSSLVDPSIADSGTVLLAPAGERHRKVRIVHGVEDNVYFHWQLAIMFESLIGQLPAGWEVNVVVCNNHAPISSELIHILDTYGVKHFTGESHADNQHMDFAGGGDRYVPLNRVEALNIISQEAAPSDLVCLMDCDIFLYGELQEQLFPSGNAMASNWIIGQEKYFQFSVNDTKGLSLPKLLEALGCEQEFKPGGVMVFMTGDTLQANGRKVILDCFRFLQILYLAGKILEMPSHGVWVAEMACFAMAMYPNGIDYDLLELEQFAVQEQNADELPEGTFFHYYTDINDGSDGPFFESQWHKQLFHHQNFLTADIDSFLDVAKGKAEIRFMTLARQARDRLYGKDDD